MMEDNAYMNLPTVTFRSSPYREFEGNKFDYMVGKIREFEAAEAAASRDGNLEAVAQARQQAAYFTEVYAKEKGWGSGSSKVAHPTQPGVDLFVPQTIEGRRRLHEHQTQTQQRFQEIMRDSKDFESGFAKWNDEQIREGTRVARSIESMESLNQQLKVAQLMANLNRAA